MVKMSLIINILIKVIISLYANITLLFDIFLYRFSEALLSRKETEQLDNSPPVRAPMQLTSHSFCGPMPVSCV